MNNTASWLAVRHFHFLVLILLLVVACGGSKSAATQESSSYTGGESTCGEFRGVVKDTRQGFLTDVEVVEKLKEIDLLAAAAEPEIRTASKALVEKATLGEADALAEATEAMVEACIEYQYW